MANFEIKEQFLLNDKPMKIYSGAVHYFRIVPAEWEQTLLKLKLAGLNTVETYIPWNLHEPKENYFNFTGIADIKSFIQIAGEMGLYVIVRPSPYICAEWDFGGFPAWLLNYSDMVVRSNTPRFMEKVAKYYKKLFEILVPLQITHNGPIIMMQIENEYGSFGNDKEYLRKIKNLMLNNGVDVPLFTADGSWLQALDSGSLIDDGVFVTANFGSDVKNNLTTLKNYMTSHHRKWPLMCMEFWDGWFNFWGEKKILRSPSSFRQDVETMLDCDANFNLYMFRGGTNFGFYNGASCHDNIYQPQITSYDYDAVLTEDGSRTLKYSYLSSLMSCRNKIIKKTKEKKAFTVNVNKRVALSEVLDDLAVYKQSNLPLTMEECGDGYGFIYYQTMIKGYNSIEKIKLLNVNDYAVAFLNRKRINHIFSNDTSTEIETYMGSENKLDILVENLGRINYGPDILSGKQHKGIGTGVMVDRHLHYGWKQWAINFKNVSNISWEKPWISQSPSLNLFEFNKEENIPHYIDCSEYGKGIIIVNGFNLGRYWNIGPSNKLYLPPSLLKEQDNKVIVFETSEKNIEQLKFI